MDRLLQDLLLSEETFKTFPRSFITLEQFYKGTSTGTQGLTTHRGLTLLLSLPPNLFNYSYQQLINVVINSWFNQFINIIMKMPPTIPLPGEVSMYFILYFTATALPSENTE